MRKKPFASKTLVRRVLRDTTPVMAGYLVLGAGFGILSRASGFGAGTVFSLSAFVYAGSMQFLAIPLLREGVSLALLALTTVLVNARHIFYGISMIDRYRDTGVFKPYLIFALTDETYSLVCSDAGKPSDADRIIYYFLVSLFDQLYWVTGSVAGWLAGSLLHFDTTGLDFALTALFLTILVDQWKTGEHRLPAVLGVLISVACLLLFGASGFLLPAMALITVSLFLIRGKEEQKDAV